MNGKDLLLGLGYVDEAHIQNAEVKTLKKSYAVTLKRYGTMAACFAVLIAAATVFYTHHLNGPTPPGPIIDNPNVSQPPEVVPEEIIVDMEQVYFNDAIGPQEDLWYDPEIYTVTTLSGQSFEDYYQRDLTPPWLPAGLLPSKWNGVAELVTAQDGTTVSDIAHLGFYSDYYKDGSPQLYEETGATKGLELSVSRVGTLTQWDYVLPEQERQATEIEGIEVMLGVSTRLCEPSGTVEVINAEWEVDGLHFLLTSQQLDRESVVKTIASIIAETPDISIIN